MVETKNLSGLMRALAAIASSTRIETLPDYIGSNLYDEWIGNSGIVVRAATSATEKWYGRYNSKILDRGTATGWALPVNGVFTKTGSGNCPQMLSQATTLSGSVTFAAVMKKASAQGSRVDWVQASSDTPTLRCELETQAAGKLGITYAGTTYSTGQAFLYDSDFHAVVFVIDTAGVFRCYMDGVKYGGDIAIPAGGIDWTAVQTRGFFEFQFNGSYRKFRIYNEALSEENALLISDPANNFFQELTVENRPVVLLGAYGQSNQQGSTMTAGSYPAYLQAEMTTAYYYTASSLVRMGKVLAGTRPSPDCGPFLAMSYSLQSKYPDADIILMEVANASQSLDAYFNSRTPGAGWTSIKSTRDPLMLWVAAEMRTIEDYIVSYIQGERDSDAAETEATAKKYNHYFEQVNNDGGNIQVQFNGVDKSSDFTIGTSLRVLSDNGVYDVTANITAVSFSTNTVVTIDSPYISAAPGGAVNRGTYKNFIDDCFSVLGCTKYIDVRVPHDSASLVTNPRRDIIRSCKNVMVNGTTVFQLNVDDEIIYPLQAVGNVHFNAIAYENIGLNQALLIP